MKFYVYFKDTKTFLKDDGEWFSFHPNKENATLFDECDLDTFSGYKEIEIVKEEG